MPGQIFKDTPAFYIDLGRQQRVASFFIIERHDNFDDGRRAGFITVGNSQNYMNEVCKDQMEGSGYWSCDKPLIGQFIAYFTYETTSEFKIVTFKAFGSENLITRAKMVQEPTLVPETKSFSKNMQTLAPRSSILATNRNPPDSCAYYTEDEGFMVFELDRPTGIEFINIIFESDQGLDNFQVPAVYEITSKCLLDTSSKLSNIYSRGFSVYLSNTTSISEESQLIYTGVQDLKIINMRNIQGATQVEWEEVLSSGFEVEVPVQFAQKPFNYVIFKKALGSRSRPCSIGIFTCSCHDLVAMRQEDYFFEEINLVAGGSQTFRFLRPWTVGQCNQCNFIVEAILSDPEIQIVNLVSVGQFSWNFDIEITAVQAQSGRSVIGAHQIQMNTYSFNATDRFILMEEFIYVWVDECIIEPEFVEDDTVYFKQYLYTGSIQFEAKFTTNDESVCPISYECQGELCQAGTFDIQTGIWQSQSNDMQTYSPGFYEIEIFGFFQKENSADFGTSTFFSVEFIDPCPESVVDVSIVSSQYLIIGNEKPIEYIITSSDTVSLSYGNQDGVSFCGRKFFYNGFSVSPPWLSLDQDLGIFSLQTIDSQIQATMETVPIAVQLRDYPQIYQTISFDVYIGFDCDQSTLIVPPSPFVDLTYVTFEILQRQYWQSESQLAESNSWLDCGPFEFTWLQQQQLGQIQNFDPSIFTVDSTEMYIQIYSEDASQVGLYTILYEVSLPKYPSVQSEIQSAFVIEILDSCQFSEIIDIIDLDPVEYQYHYLGQLELSTNFVSTATECSIELECIPPIEGHNWCSEGIFISENFVLSFDDKEKYQPGQYEIIIKGSIQNYPSIFQMQKFTFNLYDLCADSQISVDPLDSQLLFIGQEETSYQIQTTDFVSLLHGNKDGHTFCGRKFQQIGDPLPWLTLDQDSGSFTLQTTESLLQMQIVTATFDIQLGNYTQISESVSFDVFIGYACENSTLSINESPFSDQTYLTYQLIQSQSWLFDSDLVRINSWSDCGPYSFTWMYQKDENSNVKIIDSSGSSTPFTISDSDKQISVYSQDAEQAGVYTISYNVKLANYDTAVSFDAQKIAYIQTVIDSYTLYELDYFTQQESLTIDLQDVDSYETYISPPRFAFYENYDVEMGDPNTYPERKISIRIKPDETEINDLQASDDVSDYVNFSVSNNEDQSLIEVKFEKIEQSLLNTFQFIFCFEYGSAYPNLKDLCDESHVHQVVNAQYKINYPYFIDFDEQKVYEVIEGEELFVELPQVSDDDEDAKVSQQVNLSDQDVTWISYEEAAQRFKLTPNQQTPPGLNKVMVTLEDNESNRVEYVFNFMVLEKKDEEVEIDLEPTNQQPIILEPSQLDPKQPEQNEQKIEENQPIVDLPSEKEENNFVFDASKWGRVQNKSRERSKQMLSNVSRDAVIELKSPDTIIDQINQIGEVKLLFSQKMFFDDVFGGFTFQTSVQATENKRLLQDDNRKEQTDIDLSSFLKFDIESDNDSEKVVAYDVSIKQYDDTSIYLKIRFENPLTISQGQKRDRFSISFTEPELFVSQESGKCLEPDIVVQNFIPKQFPNEDAYASAVATGTSVQVVADTAFIGQFLLTLFLSVSLKSMWNLMHVMQIITYFHMVVDWPANASIMFQSLENSITLENFINDFYEFSELIEFGKDFSQKINNLTTSTSQEIEQSALQERFGIAKDNLYLSFGIFHNCIIFNQEYLVLRLPQQFYSSCAILYCTSSRKNVKSLLNWRRN